MQALSNKMSSLSFHHAYTPYFCCISYTDQANYKLFTIAALLPAKNMQKFTAIIYPSSLVLQNCKGGALLSPDW